MVFFHLVMWVDHIKYKQHSMHTFRLGNISKEMPLEKKKIGI